MVRRFGVFVVVVALLAVAVMAGWWAARVTLPDADPSDQPAAIEAVWAEAVEGSVGRVLPYSTTLRQPSNPVAVNGLAGVVTAVHPGEVSFGEVVYTVGDTPVRAIESDTPLWRDLSRGTRGDDVRILQTLLTSLEHFDGEVQGTFGPSTETAVKRWQKAEGRPQTGVVQRGEMVALSRLPVTVTLGDDIKLGKILAGGEDAVLAPTGQREFRLILTQDQGRLVPAEATVEVTYEELTWHAVIAGSQLDDNGTLEFTLVGPDGGEVCGEHCDRLPLDAQITLRSQVVVVPRVSGVAVPGAAVRSNPDGSTTVITESGPVPVTVKGSGQGLAVVEGIELGTRVQLTGQAPAPATQAPSPAQSSADPDQEG